MRAVVLGVDSSTQSCTVEVRDLDSGALISTGRSPHPVTHPPTSEQDPAAWWSAFVAATRAALADADSAGEDVEVRGISVGAQCHGLVVTDAADQVIRPAKLWNDTTSAPQASALLDWREAAWWAREIGIVPSAAITISKLSWLAQNEPASLDRAHRLSVPHDWLTTRLTGRHVTDRSDASGTGYFSASTNRWRTDILDGIIGGRDWAPLLPTVLGPEEAAGRILPDVASELGVSADAIVGPGGGDQHLAAQGVGLHPGEIAYSLGTSGVVFATSTSSVHDVTGSIDGVANTTGGYLPLVCTLNAAKVTDTIGRLLGVDHDELSALALAAPTTPDRPIMATFFDGERSPRMPWARGMLSGISSDMTREQLALAAVEGVVLGLAAGQQRMADFGVPMTGRAILIGGGARSAAYRQVVADLSGREAHTVDAPEATARGAALQAAAVVRGETVGALTSAWAPGTTSITSPKRDRAGYVLQRYQRLAALQAEGVTF